MSKAHSNNRMWRLIKDVERGTIGFYRYDLPYCIFSQDDWTYMVSHPIIRGEAPIVEPEPDSEIDSDDYPIGCA